MSEWQPIETAPKDGTEIDVWVARFDVRAGVLRITGGHRRVNASWRKPYYGDDREWEEQWCGQDGAWSEPLESATYSVTHWQPLPEPPVQP